MTTVASGPPGLEVAHQWDGGVILNQLGARPARARLTRLTGFRSHAKGEPQGLDNVNRSGGYPVQSYTDTKDVIYEGVLQAKTLDSLRVLSTSLSGAFRDKNSIKQMRLLGAVAWVFNARCTAYDEDDEQTTGAENNFPYQRTFTLGFRLYDRRFYAIDLPQSVVLPNNVSTAVQHLGATDSPPVFVIPVTAGSVVTLENNNILQPGKPFGHATLRFKAMPNSGVLTVNFHDQTATLSGTDVTAYVNLAFSSWWEDDCDGIRPGAANFIRVQGANGDSSINFYHATE